MSGQLRATGMADTYDCMHEWTARLLRANLPPSQDSPVGLDAYLTRLAQLARDGGLPDFAPLAAIFAQSRTPDSLAILVSVTCGTSQGPSRT